MTLRIIGVIAVSDKGIEWDGWVWRHEWDARDPKLAPLLRGTALVIPLDGGGYGAFIKRFKDALADVEAAWRGQGFGEACGAIERWRAVLSSPPCL